MLATVKNLLAPSAILVIMTFSLAGCGTPSVYKSPKPIKDPVPKVSLFDQAVRTAEKQGIQIIQIGDTVKMLLPADHLFYAHSSNLKPGGERLLDTTADLLDASIQQLSVVKISGHTDNVGNLRRQRLLSSAQAAHVVKYLTSAGVPTHFLYANGAGEKHPIARNTSARGRAQNRRIELLFQRVRFERNRLSAS